MQVHPLPLLPAISGSGSLDRLLGRGSGSFRRSSDSFRIGAGPAAEQPAAGLTLRQRLAKWGGNVQRTASYAGKELLLCWLVTGLSTGRPGLRLQQMVGWLQCAASRMHEGAARARVRLIRLTACIPVLSELAVSHASCPTCMQQAEERGVNAAVGRPWFEAISGVLILFNVIIMCLYEYHMAPTTRMLQHSAEYVLAFVFLAEVVLRFTALGEAHRLQLKSTCCKRLAHSI